MKEFKEFKVFTFNNMSRSEIEEVMLYELSITRYFNIPKNIKGMVYCKIINPKNYIYGIGFSFCSGKDKWDVNCGKWIAKQRALGYKYLSEEVEYKKLTKKKQLARKPLLERIGVENV